MVDIECSPAVPCSNQLLALDSVSEATQKGGGAGEGSLVSVFYACSFTYL